MMIQVLKRISSQKQEKVMPISFTYLLNKQHALLIGIQKNKSPFVYFEYFDAVSHKSLFIKAVKLRFLTNIWQLELELEQVNDYIATGVTIQTMNLNSESLSLVSTNEKLRLVWTDQSQTSKQPVQKNLITNQKNTRDREWKSRDLKCTMCKTKANIYNIPVKHFYLN